MENKLNKTLDELAAESKKQNRKRKINKIRRNSQRNNYQGRRKTLKRQRGRISNKTSQNSDLRKRLFISNLDKSCTNEQLKKLFEEYGKLTRCGIHYNDLGESLGTADIQFEKHEDAEKAINKLNNTNVGSLNISVKYSNTGKSNLRNKRINASQGRRRNIRNKNQNNRRNIGGKKNNNNKRNTRRKSFRSVGKRRRN